MSDCLKYTGLFLSLIGCAVGAMVFGYVHDDNFSNPEYAACRRRGNAMQDCMWHVRTRPIIHARTAGGVA